MTGLMTCPHCSTRVLPMAGRICPACRKAVDSEPDPEPTPEQAVGAAYGFAAEQMRDGVAPSEIQKGLTKRGLGAEAAATVVGDLEQAKAEAHGGAGRKDMIYGSLWLLAGLGVTAYTYLAAERAGGGTYILFWGAILFGGFQFLRGLVRAIA